MKEKLKDASWPFVMGLASSINVIGAGLAIWSDYQKDPNHAINTAYATSGGTSLLYAGINIYQAARIICREDKPIVGEHTALLSAQRDIEKGIQRN